MLEVLVWIPWGTLWTHLPSPEGCCGGQLKIHHLSIFQKESIHTVTCSSERVSFKGQFQTRVEMEGGFLCNSALSCLSPKESRDLKHSYQCPVRQFGCLFAGGCPFSSFSPACLTSPGHLVGTWHRVLGYHVQSGCHEAQSCTISPFRSSP